MVLFKLTPERVGHLLLLGLFWRHGPPSKNVLRNASKAGELFEAFVRMGVIPESEARQLQRENRDSEYQKHRRLVYNNCAVLLHERLIGKQDCLFCIRAGVHQSESIVERILKDRHIALLPRGAAEARKLESEYRLLGITKEAFEAASEIRTHETAVV